MTLRRCLTTRAKLLAQQRFSPSFAYIHHEDDRKNHHEDQKITNFFQSRSFWSCINTSLGSRAQFQDGRCSQFIHPLTDGLFLARHMSTTTGDGADKIEYMSDAAEVLTDKTVETVVLQGHAVSEVAIATADSWFPVAGLQYLIDWVHTFTGFNWWASIVVTTILIRGITFPLMINQLKYISKLTLMKPHLEEIYQEIEDRGKSPTAVAEGQERMKKLFSEYGVTYTLWDRWKGLLIQGSVSVSFFLAIQNMVEKVPSLRAGGAFWFIDLTTPDTLYILPTLTALTFYIAAERNMLERLKVNPAALPAAGTLKNILRVFAGFTIPLTMYFPKAIFCYWVTSNLFSSVYVLVMKNHYVKKFLGVPIIPLPQPDFSLSEAVQKYIAAQQLPTSSPTEETKPANQQRIPLHSVVRHRIRRLDRIDKSEIISLIKLDEGRKKGKKK